MRRRILALSTLLCLAGALPGPALARAACGTLRISYVQAPFNLQVMVMKERGILRKHLAELGLREEWADIDSGQDQARALARGELDIASVMNTASILMANGEDNPVRILAGVARPTDVFALVGAKGSTGGVEALRGKTVAGPPGTTLHQMLVAALARRGMGIGDVNFVHMGIPQALAALESGQADAALLAASAMVHAREGGARILARATGHVTPILAVAASQSFLQAHPERVQAFLAAHDEAWRWIEDHPAQAIELGARLHGISFADAHRLYHWSHYTQRLRKGDLEAMERDMRFLLDNGMMRRRVDVERIVTAGAMETE